MALTTLAPGPAMHIGLSGDLTIAEAAETRDALALALTTSETLDLDLGALENIDVAGLQVLLALLLEKHPVRLTNPSEALRKVVGLLHIEALQNRLPN
ncbi:STAS domain-containing protein [Uliginosibacterium sp. 31-16]|uniref:STAS domain-containing protein n=1 Tax=Uliginosibacterium sp. 31-16 TaxID=3068315 RepID=UPI00273DCDD5|nr:STAS domain-containing protein [Uliginosibacterium sp. 31-16]MDP5240250.1 STAS domain-containing protein [Uliginosibacterium sp. 31-16]